MKEILIVLIICVTIANINGSMNKKEALQFVSDVAYATQQEVQKNFDIYDKKRNESIVSNNPEKEKLAYEEFKKSLPKLAEDIKSINQPKIK